MQSGVRVLRRLGERVRRLRRAHGWTQETLAEKARVHEHYISRIENAHQNPRVLVVIRLADALNVTPGTLLDP